MVVNDAGTDNAGTDDAGTDDVHRAVTGKAAFFSVLQWIRRDFLWGLLLVPVISSTVVYFLSLRNVQGWGETRSFKDLMEILHPSLVAGFLVVSWGRWFATRDAVFAFLGVLGAFVLSRELMGQGSSFVIYTGLIFLTMYALRHPENLKDIFFSRWAASFLFMCFLCYASSQLLDRGLVKRVGWLVLWDTSWRLPYSSNIEEALEALGGFFLLLTPIVVARNGVKV